MTFVLKAAADLQPGDVVKLDDDDVATVDSVPREYKGELIAWMKGDKLPVYFDADEQVPVLAV